MWILGQCIANNPFWLMLTWIGIWGTLLTWELEIVIAALKPFLKTLIPLKQTSVNADFLPWIYPPPKRGSNLQAKRLLIHDCSTLQPVFLFIYLSIYPFIYVCMDLIFVHCIMVLKVVALRLIAQSMREPTIKKTIKPWKHQDKSHKICGLYMGSLLTRTP